MTDNWDWNPKADNVVSLPLRAFPARLPAPDQIPPREWLYGTRLIRRFVTVLVAPGGTGKSSYALAVAMALASGRPFLGETVHHRVNAWVLSLEDPLTELERRIAAIQIRHRIKDSELKDRLYLNSGRDRRLVMARVSDDGYSIVYPDKDRLIEAAEESGIGHISVDPFVKSHSLEENSNPHMDAAATAWAEVAEAIGASIELVHHTRKGAPQDIDAARGGKALTDSARVGQVMSAMSPEEASELGIRENERWQYVRLDDAKVNMAPRADKAHWFHLDMVELQNCTALYPSGDRVAAVARWEPPTPFEGLTASDCNEALDRIAKGPEPGLLYSPTQRGRENTRWAGSVLIDGFGIEERQTARVIHLWLQSGLLYTETFRDPRNRHDRVGVRVCDEKRPT